MEHLSTILNNYLRGARAGSSNADIARYLLAHLDETPRLRVDEIAQACYVSRPTVIRFVRELGFADYTAFKEHARGEHDHLRVEKRGSDVATLAAGEGTREERTQAWGRMVGHAMCDAVLSVDEGQVRSLAEDILAYRHVYVIGASVACLFGDYLNARLSFQGKALVSTHKHDLSATLGTPRDETLVVLVSQHGNLLRDEPRLFDYLHAQASKTWLVTQIPKGRFNERVVDEVLRVAEGSVESDAFVLLAVAELVGHWCRVLDPLA